MTGSASIAVHRANTSPASSPDIGALITTYAAISGTSVEDLVGKSQAQPITRRRHELMFLIRRLAPAASFSTIGRFIGGRDMATVHEAIVNVESRMQGDHAYADVMAGILAMMRRQAAAEGPAGSWPFAAALSVLRDDAITDAEARKVALVFLMRLEAAHG